MSSNINNFVRPTENADRKDINRILEMIHDLVSPEPEEEGVNERVMLRDHVRVKTNTVTVAGPDLLDSDTKARRNFIMRRRMPETVKSYPLVHTENSFSGIIFPKLDTRFGARIDFDGVGTITIDDNTLLKPTNEITIAGWFWLPSLDTTIRVLLGKGGNFWEIRTNTSDAIIARMGVNSVVSTLEFTNPVASRWYHFVMAAKSGEQRLWIDKVSQDNTSTSGTLDTSTNDVRIGANVSDTQKVLSGTRLAHISILNMFPTQAWVDNHFEGITDTDGTNIEILTIPFLQSARPKPNATSGLCRST